MSEILWQIRQDASAQEIGCSASHSQCLFCLWWPKKVIPTQKKTNATKTEVWEHSEIRGMEGGGGEWAGDGHYWQWWGRRSTLLAAVSFMSETEKDSLSKKRHERGGVRVKEKSGNHLKAVWGLHLSVLRISPFANIPRPQKTLYSSFLMFFFCCFFDLLLRRQWWEENTLDVDRH